MGITGRGGPPRNWKGGLILIVWAGRSKLSDFTLCAQTGEEWILMVEESFLP